MTLQIYLTYCLEFNEKVHITFMNIKLFSKPRKLINLIYLFRVCKGEE